MAEGLQPVFSYLTGAGMYRRRNALLRFSGCVFLAVGVAGYGLILLFSRGFFAIFSPGDAELVRFAAQTSRTYFCGFFLAGLNILLISFWQSSLQTRKALCVSLGRSLLFPPLLLLLLPRIFGAQAVWLCHSAAEALTACVAIALLCRKHDSEVEKPALPE